MPTTAWLRYIPAVRGPQLEEALDAPERALRMKTGDLSVGGLLLAERPLPAIQLARVPVGRPQRRH